MKIISFEQIGNTITCGFNKHNFVVFASMSVVDGYSEDEYKQLLYRVCKDSIDYEEQRYFSGEPVSIPFNQDDYPDIEEFIPEESTPSEILLIPEKLYVEMSNDRAEVLDLEVIVRDQYGKSMDSEVEVTTTYGSIANNKLIMPFTEIVKNISLTAKVGDVESNIDIEVYSGEPFDLYKEQDSLIQGSKEMLDKYLEEHPYTHIDGKMYSVTKDKQNLLNNAIAVYQMKTQMGLPAEIKWNATGKSCTVWDIQDIIPLALAIASYVEPLISYQQDLEIAIRNCTTKLELFEIVIDYESV